MPIEEQQNPASQKSVYSATQIGVATFLGGPLTAGYLLAQNYSVFEQPEKVTKSWIYSVIATVVVFTIAFTVPNIPNQVLPIAYTVGANYFVKSFQNVEILTTISAGGKYYGWGRTILIGLIGLIITMVSLAIVILLIPEGN